MHACLDGDILKYRAGFAAEKGEYLLVYEYWVGLEQWTDTESYTYKKDLDLRIKNLGLKEGEYEVEFRRVPEPVENALHNVKSIVNEICKALSLNLDEVTVYLSGPTNFREDIATIRGYKENRKEAHRPVHGPAIEEYIKKTYTYNVSEGEEADDVIGYTHYASFLEDPESSIVVSTDKDLDMIPGLHYNFVREESYYVSEEEALRIFYTQLLVGDPTDNIAGCPGIGKAKAKALLEGITDEPSLYEAVRNAYAKAITEYDSDEDLLENARLLWIRRKPGELWEPPKENN